MADFRSVWQNTHANLNTACHLLDQSLGLFLDLWKSSEQGGRKQDLPGYLWEKQNDSKAAEEVLANPESKDKARESPHYCEP